MIFLGGACLAGLGMELHYSGLLAGANYMVTVGFNWGRSYVWVKGTCPWSERNVDGFWALAATMWDDGGGF